MSLVSGKINAVEKHNFAGHRAKYATIRLVLNLFDKNLFRLIFWLVTLVLHFGKK